MNIMNKNAYYDAIKSLAIYMLELLAIKSDYEFIDRTGNLCRFADDVPAEVLQDLLDAKVDFISEFDTTGFLYPSDTPIKELLAFTQKYPGCVFSTILTYGQQGNIVKLTVVGLANYNDTSTEFGFALAAVAPSNTDITFTDDGVFACMDMPYMS